MQFKKASLDSRLLPRHNLLSSRWKKTARLSRRCKIVQLGFYPLYMCLPTLFLLRLKCLIPLSSIYLFMYLFIYLCFQLVEFFSLQINITQSLIKRTKRNWSFVLYVRNTHVYFTLWKKVSDLPVPSRKIVNIFYSVLLFLLYKRSSGKASILTIFLYRKGNTNTMRVE